MFEPEPWDVSEGPMLSALTYSQVQSKKEDAVKAAETLYLEEASKKSKKKKSKNKKKSLSKDDEKVKDEPCHNKENKNEEGNKSNECGTNGKTKKKKKKSNEFSTDDKSDDNIKKTGSQSKLSQLSSALKGQQRLGVMTADRLMNSPGATKHLMGSDSEDASSPVLKMSSKKKKNKNVSENSSRTRLNSAKDRIVEAGAKLHRALSSSSNVVDEEEEDRDEGEGNSDNILTKGIKFSSQNAFMRFVGHKKAKKRKNVEELDGSDNNGFEDTPAKQTNGDSDKSLESPTKKAKKDNLGSVSTESDSSPQSPSKKAKRERKSKTESPPSGDSKISPSALNGSGINLAKLRQVLENTDSVKTPETLKSKKTIGDISKERLAGARFRYLNEQLYTQPAGQSFKQFTKDEDLFHTYHSGYQQQAKQWPLDPLNLIIATCLKMPDNHVIADMGCGEARLARSVPNKVHSFDLVSTSPAVTACEMSNTPLDSGEVDVVVFCLSLMGTNVRDFLFEAGRILKMGGTLKIAELESRFQSTYSLDNFISDVCKFGFKNSWKDVKKGYFYFVDFKKVTEVKKKKKLPEINLKPCLYKKR